MCVFWLCRVWDLSSPTRDQTCAPALGSVLTTGLPGKSPQVYSLCDLDVDSLFLPDLIFSRSIRTGGCEVGEAGSLESNPWPSWLTPPPALWPGPPHGLFSLGFLIWKVCGSGGGGWAEGGWEWLWGFDEEMNRKATCNLSYEASQVAQMIKNPPAMQETWVRSLGQEDPLEEDLATHSSILAWRIPWTEEPGGLQSMGWQSWTRLSDWTATIIKT